MLRRPLAALSLALLAWWVLLLAVSVGAGWPAEIGGGATVDEWPSQGTLVAPPLVPLGLQAVFTGLLLLPYRRGRLAAGTGLAVLGGVYLVAGLGEPWEPELSDAPLWALVLLRVPALAGSAALVLLGLRELAASWRARP